MNKVIKILIAYGTRPEILKLIPVIFELKKRKEINIKLINTGQHKEMVTEIEDAFGIEPDYMLNIMQTEQSLTSIFVNVLKTVEPILNTEQPNVVVVQGDTSTVAAVGTCCFYKRIPVAHVEAGLRSFDLEQPFPEEFNRKLISIFAEFNFVPTAQSAANLQKEGVPAASIYQTGNTIVDMVELAKTRITKEPSSYKKILITAHRRENHGDGIREICHAVQKILMLKSDIHFTWPIHPNPVIQKIVKAEIGQMERVNLVSPLGYFEMLNEIQSSFLIWTDSGGVQEECPAFRKPVLILRNVTERPEVVESGFGKLVGTNADRIVSSTLELINDNEAYKKRASGINPFGDGKASVRIADILTAEIFT